MYKFALLPLFLLIKLTAIAQNDATTYYNNGQKKYEAGNFRAAIRDFDTVVRLIHSEWAYYSRGHCRYYTGDYAGAIADMDSVLQINPRNAPALRCRGASKRLIKNYTEALEDLNKSITISLNDTTYLNLGLLYFDTQDTAGALANYNKMLRHNPIRANYILMGTLLTNLNQCKAAFAYYDSARAMAPDSSDYLIELDIAWTQLVNQEYGKAIEHYTEMLKQYPHKAQLHVLRGKALEQVGDQRHAMREYRRAIRAERNNPVGYIAKAYLRYRQSAFVRARTDYAQAIKMDPQNAALYYYRGICLKALDRYIFALKSFSEAIQLNPSYAAAYRERGNMELILENPKKAGADFFKAAQLGNFK